MTFSSITPAMVDDGLRLRTTKQESPQRIHKLEKSQNSKVKTGGPAGFKQWPLFVPAIPVRD